MYKDSVTEVSKVNNKRRIPVTGSREERIKSKMRPEG